MAQQRKNDQLPDLISKAVKHRQRLQINALLRSSPKKRIEKLVSDQLLLENVIKLDILGNLVQNMPYQDCKNLYFTISPNLSLEKKLALRRLVHAKHFEHQE